VKELVPVMGIHCLRESKNHSTTALHTERWSHSTGGMSHHRGGPQTERVVQSSDQINTADLNCKAKGNVESKETCRIKQCLMLGGGGRDPIGCIVH
jgi:hypothetical protein